MIMNLVFIGPPGSGKGTQANRLSRELGMVHLATGDILRLAVRDATELGLKAKAFMNDGELVPDNLVVELIREILECRDLKNGFILDGFPRTIPQAESLERMLKESDSSIDRVVLLSVPDEEIIKRLSGRWHCPKCNEGYNYPMHVPKTEGKCDSDGSNLQRRPDDEESVVRHRLDVYKSQTEPILDFYVKKSKLVEINGQNHPDTVYHELLKLAS